MENKTIQKRLATLRRVMEELHVDYYMVTTADYHNSEYVSDYFKVRKYLCGFTGSNGTLVVSQRAAGLWTDGRYFIQAEKELAGTGVSLYRMGEEGVPTIEAYLREQLQEGESLGFDGRTISVNRGKHLEELLHEKQGKVVWDRDLAELVWQERPPFPASRVYVLPEEVTGKNVTEKLAEVREKLKEKKADALLLSKLDDIMWLFNIRGNDVECNPVALSYAYITLDGAEIFLSQKAVDDETAAYFEKHHIRLWDYNEITNHLQRVIPGTKVWIDDTQCSYALYRLLEGRAEIQKGANPTELMKAVKNDTELARMREIYRQDSAAVCKFIYWLKNQIGNTTLTEYDAAMYLDGLRKQIPGFVELSFPTISAYAENAAMMHYEATEEQAKKLQSEGMLLVDSGGQYLGGTTDVTRTIVLGEISEEVKGHFTAVASGMLQLSDVHFLYGCSGRNLDILARQPLWDLHIDYKCGTGHGVGYLLNVHEGPQNIRWRFAQGSNEAILEPGMAVTNEPGVYIEGSHGIRTENVLVVTEDVKNGDGQFLKFETLTFVPIDRDAIDASRMSAENLERLNAYHKRVREVITPYLEEAEAKWLYEVTEPITGE